MFEDKLPIAGFIKKTLVTVIVACLCDVLYCIIDIINYVTGIGNGRIFEF